MNLTKFNLFVIVSLQCSLLTFCQEAPCTTEVHNLIRPFAGTWQEFEVTDDGEEFIGTLRSFRDTKNCALSQTFVSVDSSFSYRTLGYVEPGANVWVETYVFSTGSTAFYHWIVDDGDIVQRRVGGSRQIGHMHQLRFVNVTEDSYTVIQEESLDGGLTWEQTERTNIRKVSD